MQKYLQQRIEALFARYDTVTLATCGPAGPQISVVSYTVQKLQPLLFLSQTSDHLFNLETQPALVLLTAGWRLHGTGQISTASSTRQPWQSVVVVNTTRLHILDANQPVETIDF